MRYVLLLYLALFTLLPVMSRTGTGSWFALNNNDGMTESRVRCIRELPDGRLAIATTATIDIYDGTRFHSSPVSPGMAYPLPDYHAYRRLNIDDAGRIWLHNRGTLHVFSDTGEALQAGKVLAAVGWKGGTVTAAFIDNGMKTTRYWLVSPDGVLYCCGGKGCTAVTNLKLSGCGIPESIVSAGTRIYLGYASNKVCELSTATSAATGKSKTGYTGTMVFCGSPKNGVQPGKLRNGIKLFLHGGSLWITLNSYDEKSAYIERLDTSNHEWLPSITVPMRISDIKADKGGGITAVGNHGIYTIDGNTATIHRQELLAEGSSRTVATNEDLSGILHDRYGGTWIGTVESGLLYHNPQRTGLITAIPEPYPGKPAAVFCSDRAREQAGIHAEGITNCSAETSDGLLYLGTRDGLLVIDGGGRVTAKMDSRDGMASSNVQAILARSDKDIWITTATGISHIAKRGAGAYDLTHYGKLDNLDLGGHDLHPGEMYMDGSLVYAGAGNRMYCFNPDSLLASRRYTFHHSAGTDDGGTHSSLILPLCLVAAAALAATATMAYRRKKAKTAGTDEGKEGKESTIPTQGIADKEREEFAARLRGIVETHIADRDFSVQALAAEMAMDRTVLFRRMQTLMNISPSTYIRNVKMETAKRLLKEGYSTADAARMTGFSSAKYFSRILKENAGQTSEMQGTPQSFHP